MNYNKTVATRLVQCSKQKLYGSSCSISHAKHGSLESVKAFSLWNRLTSFRGK